MVILAFEVIIQQIVVLYHSDLPPFFSGNSDDVAKNRANFGIFEIDFWAFLWLKLNSGQHFTLPFLSLLCI